MISDLEEINRVLSVFDQNQTTSMNTSKFVHILRDSPIITQTLRDHKASIKFCFECELIAEANEQMILLKRGRDLLKMLKRNNPSGIFDINEQQCNLLNRECFLNVGSIVAKTITDHFVTDDEKQTWSYDYSENPPLPEEFMEYVHILKQSKLLIEESATISINVNYCVEVSLLFSRKRTMSQAEFEAIQAERSSVGYLAEQRILEYEKNALASNACAEESEHVKWISQWDTAAGFDIKSFSGPSLTKQHDKFIEVKGSKNSAFRIFWSENEINMAKALGEKYWIYFLPNVFETSVTAPIMIRDPAKNILKSSKYKKKCIGYEITMKGAPQDSDRREISDQ